MRYVIYLVLLCCATANAAQPFGLELVDPDQATHASVKAGRWEDADTWNCGVPGDGARVLIGHDVKVHTTTADAEWIHIKDGGDLSVCDHCNTQINVRTLYLAMGGNYTQGSVTMPVRPTATSVLEILPGGFGVNDFRKAGGGVIGHGEFSVCGAEKTAWATMHGDILVGGTTLTLDQVPYNWNIGDTILIAGTDGMLGEDMSITHRYQSEYKTITAVNGKTVTFSPPAVYRHFQWRPDLVYHVSNLTRNVKIRSRSTATVDDRGHMMFHVGSNVIMWAELTGLGRTVKGIDVTDPRRDHTDNWVEGSNANPRGRYADHNHNCGPLGPLSVRVATVIRDSVGWGLVNHNSNCLWLWCIGVDCDGAAFVTEEGQERGRMAWCLAALNRGQGDYVVSTDDDHGKRSIGDWGKDGSGFWMQGGLVDVVDCVSHDNGGRGFAGFNRPLNNYGNYGSYPQNTDATVPWIRYPIVHHSSLLSAEYATVPNADSPNAISSTVPQRVFLRNTAYNNKVAVQLWAGPIQNDSSQSIWPLAVRSDYRDFVIWGRGAKLHMEYTRQTNVTGLTIVGDNGFRPAYNSINKMSEAVLLRGPEVTIKDWHIEGVQANMTTFHIEQPDPAKNIVIENWP